MLTGESGGTPWDGRELPPSPYAGDTGGVDERLARALDRFAVSPQTEAEVVAALAAARLFVAVVARPAVPAVTDLVDEDAHMALITTTGRDGRRALPVFSSTAALSRWRPDARPVPVPGRRAALSAVAEGCDLLDLDPAGPVAYQVRRPAVWALGRGLPWTPSYADPLVAQEISLICSREGLTATCEPGASAELRVVLTLPPGLDEQRVHSVTARLSHRLAASELVADGVDSLELTVLPGAVQENT